MQKSIRTSLNTAAILGLLLLILAASSEPTYAAPAQQEPPEGEWPSLILRAGHVDGGSKLKVFPPGEYLRSSTKTASIVVNYIGYWDPAAQAAFEYAKGIWEAQITSPVTITVDAYWEDLNYISPNVLGGASASEYRTDFPGALIADTWYPLALANKLAGSDLDPDLNDIEASFNCSFTGWNFGTEGNPSSEEYDFVSVVLHEIGHGLGFSGSMQIASGRGRWGFGTGFPFIYDLFAVNGSGQHLLADFPNDSAELAAQLKSTNLFFSGSQAMAANGGITPRLYAPSSWEQGSSYSHLDEGTYPTDSVNALMTPALMNGEALHSPGPITMGIFEDLGWGAAVDETASFSTAARLDRSPARLSQMISRDRPAQSSYSCQPAVTSTTLNFLPAIYWTYPTTQ